MADLGTVTSSTVPGVAWFQDVNNLTYRLDNTTNAAYGDALVGVKRTETGAEATTLHFYIQRSQLRLTDFLTSAECDDILAGTGSIDVSSKFSTALARAAGGVLILPSGRIKASALTVSGTRTTVVGAGGRSTRISCPSATNDVFTVSGDYVDIRELMIDSSVTRTGGWYVDFQSTASRSRIGNFYMDGFINGIRTSATATVTIERGELLNGVATSGVAIRVNDGYDVSVRDIIVDAASQIYSAIYVNKVNDLTIEDCNLIHGGNALFLNPGAGQVIASVWANNSFFDTSTRGVYGLADGAGAAIVRCIFDECWASGNTSEGIRLATNAGGYIRGIDIQTPHIFSNGGDGILVADSGVKEIHVRGGEIAGNTSAGVSFSTNVTNCSVIGSRIGDCADLSGNNTGVNIASGCTNLVVRDNNLSGNTSVNLSNSATSVTNEVDANLAANGWTSYTPTVTSGSGSFTTLGTVSGKSSRDGKRLALQLSIAITTNGTAATSVVATIPNGMTAAADQVVYGRENSSTGAMVQGIILSGQSTISITKYDNTYPGGSGYRLVLGGVIEVN